MTRRGFFGRLAACGGAVAVAPTPTRAEPAIERIHIEPQAVSEHWWSVWPPLQAGETISINSQNGCYVVNSTARRQTTVTWPSGIPGPGGSVTWSLRG